MGHLMSRARKWWERLERESGDGVCAESCWGYRTDRKLFRTQRKTDSLLEAAFVWNGADNMVQCAAQGGTAQMVQCAAQGDTVRMLQCAAQDDTDNIKIILK